MEESVGEEEVSLLKVTNPGVLVITLQHRTSSRRINQNTQHLISPHGPRHT
jgi:hypothetical protein